MPYVQDIILNLSHPYIASMTLLAHVVLYSRVWAVIEGKNFGHVEGSMCKKVISQWYTVETSNSLVQLLCQ